MQTFLRQSTASQSRVIGPFVDDTDGKTPETGLTIANTDIQLIASGAAAANKNSGGATHRVNGEYAITLDATDTATVGELLVSVVVAGALPVRAAFFVLEESVYDAFFGAGAEAKVDLIDAPNATAIAAVQAGLATSAGVSSGLSSLETHGDAEWATADLTGIATSSQLGDLPTASENADALLDRTDGVESGWTLRQALRIVLAVLSGNSTGGGANYANPAGNKTRIQSTIDGSGNRTVSDRDVT